MICRYLRPDIYCCIYFSNNKYKMGNNTLGSTKITYVTKDKIPVSYIYYDLKGKNRFP